MGLAEKIKLYFPKLPICLLADGLYPNKTFMNICLLHGWQYISLLPDDSLKILDEDVYDLKDEYRHLDVYTTMENGSKHIEGQYTWLELPVEQAGHQLYWVSCVETVRKYDKKQNLVNNQTTCFVYLTSIKPSKSNVPDICYSVRLRWKIENQGFNIQKTEVTT